MTLSNISQRINDAFSSLKCHATSAYEQASVEAGNLGSHMVSQFDSFIKFTEDCKSNPSDENLAQVFQRIATGFTTGLTAYQTLKALGASAMALLRGRIFASLGFGILGASMIPSICLLASLTLNPQGLVRALKSTLETNK
jgi:hypothetical protein